MTKPRLGYIIGSHVVYSNPLHRLLITMLRQGIEADQIIINVNGSGQEHHIVENDINYYYSIGEFGSPFAPLVNHELGPKLGIDYWMFLNSTSECGPEFKRLSEEGFDPEADATLAGAALNLSGSGTWGRAINDLAVYKYEYLLSVKDTINAVADMSHEDHITKMEGWYFAHAPKQSRYPVIGYELDRSKTADVYGTGVLRATEYYPGIDLYRYKHNFGQLPAGKYQIATP